MHFEDEMSGWQTYTESFAKSTSEHPSFTISIVEGVAIRVEPDSLESNATVSTETLHARQITKMIRVKMDMDASSEFHRE